MNVILDVNPNPEVLDWEQDFIRKLNVSSIGCCGTETEGGCPVLRGEPCHKVEAADGVIFQLDLDRVDHRWILANYVRILGGTNVPVTVVVTPFQKTRWANLLKHVEVFTPPVTTEKLNVFVDEVDHAFGINSSLIAARGRYEK